MAKRLSETELDQIARDARRDTTTPRLVWAVLAAAMLSLFLIGAFL